MDASDRRAVTRRLLDHLANGTTDQAEDVLRVPVSAYRDEEIWQREREAIFRRSPIVVAMSAHLPEPGCYRALDAGGIPVLSVRQEDGGVRVFLNVCRHRGAQVCEAGLGSARRFTCPYHAWTYDHAGALVGVPGEATFGALDRGAHGLTELPSREFAGFVFAILTPGAELDLEGWLYGYGPVLEALGMADMHVYTEREVAGPNWKVAYDGYVDAYHLDKLHRTTLGTDFMGNVAAEDAFGPHQRLVFPQRSIEQLRDQPESTWGAWGHLGAVHTIFPHVSIAGGPGIPTMVSQLFPGPTPDRSRTIQTHVVPKPLETDEERTIMNGVVDFLERVVREEDYATGLGIQAALDSGANDAFVFGRNEPCNQNFHRWVERIAATGN